MGHRETRERERQTNALTEKRRQDGTGRECVCRCGVGVVRRCGVVRVQCAMCGVQFGMVVCGAWWWCGVWWCGGVVVWWCGGEVV